MTITRKESVFTAIAHRWNYIFGKEKKVLHYEAGKPNVETHNLVTGEVTHEEGTKAKTYTTFEKVNHPAKAVAKCTSMPRTRVLRVRLVKGLKVTIWLELALLVVRHFCPEIQEQIPAVYQFLDGVALPIINWLYAIVLKAVQWLISQPMIQNILEMLKNLAM